MSEAFDENRVGGDGRTYRECVALQERIDAATTEIAHEYDKHLLAVASGAFALTLVFLKDIAPDPQYTVFLFTAWLGFASSIMTNLLAKLFSQWAMERAAEINEATYRHRKGTFDASNKYAALVVRLNKACFILLVLGFVAVLAFALANQKGTFMSKGDPNTRPAPQQPRPLNPHTDAPGPYRPVAPAPSPASQSQSQKK